MSSVCAILPLCCPYFALQTNFDKLLNQIAWATLLHRQVHWELNSNHPGKVFDSLQSSVSFFRHCRRFTTGGCSQARQGCMATLDSDAAAMAAMIEQHMAALTKDAVVGITTTRTAK
jgi:hypothetical protein